MVSRGTEALRAASSAAYSRALRSGSDPPSFAATMISRTSLPMTWPRFVALATRPACFHCAPMRSLYRLPEQRSTNCCWTKQLRHETLSAQMSATAGNAGGFQKDYESNFRVEPDRPGDGPRQVAGRALAHPP